MGIAKILSQNAGALGQLLARRAVGPIEHITWTVSKLTHGLDPTALTTLSYPGLSLLVQNNQIP
ncbi:hypothetical protein M7I_7195 [Glarea lozoyensis 74030]|uniref:Uncharacterized protein n=1 Tax=Glarea lozoyensis (strain ATCC 74030 / MF5533) TaxID=1104152 RepID=H0EWM5_GLAL7|nr:hypothetical protein M7I_7195 [Glarea lozoyensis 74030]